MSCVRRIRPLLISCALAFCLAFSMLGGAAFTAVAAGQVVLGTPEWVSAGSTYKLSELEISGVTSNVTTVVVTASKGSIDTSAVSGSNVQVNKDLGGNTVSLTFSPAADASVVQSTLRKIVFTYIEGQEIDIDLSDKATTIPSTATITELNSHYYMYVAVSGSISWTDALSAAKNYEYMGRQGYLATITSQTEDDTLTNISSAGAWSAGHLKSGATTSASNYIWMDGPEKNETVPTVTYANDGWGWNNNEPNNYGGSEVCMQVNYSTTRAWNDLADAKDTTNIAGYFVEFGGYAEGEDPGSPNQSLDPIASGSETISPFSVTATYSADRVSVTNPATALPGTSLSAAITALSGWDQPTASQVSVTMGGNTLVSGTGYTYDPSTGALSLSKVTGNVVITVADTMPTWYTQDSAANETALEEALAATDLDNVDSAALDTLKSGWDELTEDQKNAIAADQGTTAQEISDKLKALDDADGFDTTYEDLKDITALDPASSDYADQKEKIDAAKAAYDQLSDEAKELVPQEYKNLFAAQDFADAYKDLYEKNPVTADDLADLQAADEAYNNLTEEQKALVDAMHENLADKLAGAGMLDDNKDIIAKSPVTKDDLTAIDDAIADYDALSDEQKKAIDPDGSIKADLDAKKDAATWADTNDYILSKDPNEIGADDLDELRQAIEAYDLLSDEAKAQIDPTVLQDLLDKQSDAFIQTYLTGDDGNIYTEVNADNYEQVLSGKTDWDEMSQDEKDAINAQLQDEIGKTYEELIAEAEALQASTNDFIDEYLTGDDGEIYKEATTDNYEQILSGEEAWNALSQDEKDAINAKLVANGGKTYEELLAQAKEVKAQVEAAQKSSTSGTSGTSGTTSSGNSAKGSSTANTGDSAMAYVYAALALAIAGMAVVGFSVLRRRASASAAPAYKAKHTKR